MKKKAISKIKVANHSEERIAELEESYACLRDSYLHIIKVMRIRTFVEKAVIISLFVGAAIMVILKVLGVL